MQKFAFISDFRFYGLHRRGPLFVLEGKEARPLSVPNHLTVMESVLVFVIAELNCGQEFKSKLLSMLKRHDAIITKYSGRHSLSASTAAKLV